MWSRYLRIRKRDGVVAVFHELHPDPVYCSEEQWKKLNDEITDGTEILIGDLVQRKLIVESREVDSSEFEKVSSILERKLNQPRILYLMTAQGCNFGCGYCPVPETAQKYGASLLSVQDAIAGIELWQEHLKDVYDPNLQYSVIFYGGEPLLNKGVIKASLAYLRAKQKTGAIPSNISFTIATNGVLIDDETISICKEYNVMVVVGLDGPKGLNDVLKVDSSGNGTFNQIITSIKKLVQSGIRTCASASITPFNINHISEYFSFFRELGVEKFGFNFLKGKKLLDLVGVDGVENYSRRAVRGIIDNARKSGQSGFEYQWEKKQIAFDRKDFYPVDCTCYGNQLVIQPDGQISNCPFYKACLGQVRNIGNDFRIWKQPIVKEWRKRHPLYHSGEAKAINGGGCAWSQGEIKGDLLAVDDTSRIFSEEALDELIWSRYDRLKNHET